MALSSILPSILHGLSESTWDRPKSSSRQFWQNTFATVGSAIILANLQKVTGRYLLNPRILCILPLGLEALCSFAKWYVRPQTKAQQTKAQQANPTQRRSIVHALNIAHRKWDRVAQVASVIGALALGYLGAARSGASLLLYGASLISLLYSLHCDRQRQRIADATAFIRRPAITSEKLSSNDVPPDEEPPKGVRPYYHLFTLFHETEQELQGTNAERAPLSHFLFSLVYDDGAQDRSRLAYLVGQADKAPWDVWVTRLNQETQVLERSMQEELTQNAFCNSNDKALDQFDPSIQEKVLQQNPRALDQIAAETPLSFSGALVLTGYSLPKSVSLRDTQRKLNQIVAHWITTLHWSFLRTSSGDFVERFGDWHEVPRETTQQQ